MKPNKKVIAIAIIIPILALGGYFVFNQFFANPQVKIHVGSGMVQEYKNADNTLLYNLTFTLNPIKENGKIIELYNCQYTLSYLATNGSWVSKTANIGTHDFDWWQERTFTVPMKDFKLDPNHMTANGMYAAEQQSIEVSAFGYKKP